MKRKWSTGLVTLRIEVLLKLRKFGPVAALGGWSVPLRRIRSADFKPGVSSPYSHLLSYLALYSDGDEAAFPPVREQSFADINEVTPHDLPG
jgi:hypothetical protein